MSRLIGAPVVRSATPRDATHSPRPGIHTPTVAPAAPDRANPSSSAWSSNARDAASNWGWWPSTRLVDEAPVLGVVVPAAVVGPVVGVRYTALMRAPMKASSPWLGAR